MKNRKILWNSLVVLAASACCLGGGSPDFVYGKIPDVILDKRISLTLTNVNLRDVIDSLIQASRVNSIVTSKSNVSGANKEVLLKPNLKWDVKITINCANVPLKCIFDILRLQHCVEVKWDESQKCLVYFIPFGVSEEPLGKPKAN